MSGFSNIRSQWVNGDLVLKVNSTGEIVATISSSGVSAAIAGNVAGNVTGQCFGTVTSYAADGAIALTDKVAILNGATASVAATIAAGTEGQVVTIKATDVTNAVTLVPASFVDGTTITFSNVNEYAVLVSDGANWMFVGGDATVS